MNLGLKCPQPLIDRDQHDNRTPSVDQVLKRRSNLIESAQNLVHGTKRDFADNDRGSQQNVAKDVVGLEVEVTTDVEIHEVQIKSKVVVPDVGEQSLGGRRIDAGRIILAQHQLLAVSRFDALVEKLNSGQSDADQRQQTGP